MNLNMNMHANDHMSSAYMMVHKKVICFHCVHEMKKKSGEDEAEDTTCVLMKFSFILSKYFTLRSVFIMNLY